ncbi:MAG TPA: hypothetical protein VGO58_10320 [Chitinophagaceae bacterium]|nr:hypothetical protein [Chitinophagaceae bacterium]
MRNSFLLRKTLGFNRSVLAFILSLGTAIGGHSQPGSSSLPNTVPRIFPPSPEASALAKYVDIPVSLYTGVPQIDQPIFTVSEGDISVPIHLSYQSGGFKADELASRTGLGWVLNAGGMITRSIRGSADEYEEGFLMWRQRVSPEDFKSGTGTAAELFQRYDGIARQCGDAEPDEFFMNFNGITGKFAYNWDGTISYSCSRQLKITPLDFTPGERNYIKRWEVLTDDGMKYEFDVTESTKTLNIMDFLSCTHGDAQVNTWHLTKITAPNGEFVNFTYTPYILTHRILTSDAIQHQDYGGPGVRTTSVIRNRVKGWVLSQITTSSGQVSVEFKAVKTRLDEEPPDQSFTDRQTEDYKSLDTIIIKNKSNAVVSKHALAYDYSTARLTLRSITEIGSDGVTAKPPTQFQYKPGGFPLEVMNYAKDHWGFLNNNNTGTLVPPYFYNGLYSPGANREPDGAKSQYGLLTKIIYPTGGSQTFEYEPHDYSTQEYAQLPPKYVMVETEGGPYDPDTVTSAPFTVGNLAEHTEMLINMSCYQYSECCDPSPRVWFLNADGTTFCIDNPYPLPDICAAGGIWVEYTLHIPPDKLPPGTYKIRAYAKGVFYDGEGGPNRGDYAHISASWTESGTQIVNVTKIVGGARIRTITSEESPGDPNKMVKRFEYRTDDGLSSGQPVMEITDASYASTTMFNSSSDPNGMQPLGVLTRLATSRSTLGSTQGSHIGYNQVTIYNGTNGENGKSVSKFKSPYDYPDIPSNTYPYYLVATNFPYPPHTSMDYQRGLLEEETQYKKEGGSYKAVNRSEYKYKFSVVNIPAFNVGVFIAGGGPWGAGFLNRYRYGVYSLNIGLSQVDTVRTDLIVNGKTFRNESFNNYDTSLHFLKKETKMVSGSKQLITEYFYPQDYLLPSMAMLEMIDLHRFPLIEQIVSVKGSDGKKKAIGASFTDYKKIGNLLLAERYYKLVTSKPIENFAGTLNRPNASVNPSQYKEISWNAAFDSTGNILQVKSKEKESQVYIWGYDKTLPVARVDNATVADVAFCDFEDSDQGGFIFNNASGNFSTDSRTGKKSFRGPSLTRAIAGGKSFKVSFWAKGGSSVNVNGVPRAVGSGWTFCEWDIAAGSSNVTITTNGCQVDGVRLHPAGSLMETYTHEPLVGMTSSCSVNNTITYYEYDALGRLSIVRDENRNIIKSYQYNY